MKKEFENKLKDLMKDYDVFIWGTNSGISYDEESDSLSVEGLLIEVKNPAR